MFRLGLRAWIADHFVAHPGTAVIIIRERIALGFSKLVETRRYWCALLVRAVGALHWESRPSDGRGSVFVHTRAEATTQFHVTSP